MMHRLSQYIRYLDDEKAVLLVGAGISVLAGCSGLAAVKKKLSEIDSIKADLKSMKTDNISNKELLAFIKSKCKTPEDQRKYEGNMRESIVPDPNIFVRDYMPFVKIIKKIYKFPPIITTNVDSCLESTKEFDMTKVFYRPDDMTLGNLENGGIFHIHGYLEDSQNEVWDLYDYEKRYNQNFKDFLVEVFKSYSILYVGYAFGDQELLTQMALAKINNSSAVRHFALLPDDDFPPHVDEGLYEHLYNIHVIKYGPRASFVRVFCEWIESNFGGPGVAGPGTAMFMPSV